MKHKRNTSFCTQVSWMSAAMQSQEAGVKVVFTKTKMFDASGHRKVF